MRATIYCVLAASAAGNELTLIEASGSAAGDAVTLGRFCAPPSDSVSGETQAALVNSSSGMLFILGGPTPHVLGRHPITFALGGAFTSVATADLDGDGWDELVLAGSGTILTIGIDHANCSHGEQLDRLAIGAPIAAMAFLAAGCPMAPVVGRRTAGKMMRVPYCFRWM